MRFGSVLSPPLVLAKKLFELDRQGLVARTVASEVERTDLQLSIPGLPGSLEGFRIVQISDLHAGAFGASPTHRDRIAHLIGDARPDVLVITGDFLYRSSPVAQVIEVVRFLMPASATPTLAVLGNHDYHAGEERVAALRAGLESAGVRMLANAETSVVRGRAAVTFAGLSLSEPGWDQAVARTRSSSSPRVILLHEPDVAENVPPGTGDLVLAGHTHGAQLAVPGLERPISRAFCGSRYVAGWYAVNGMPMYVNRGVGLTGIPFRFRAAPEVTCVDLIR